MSAAADSHHLFKPVEFGPYTLTNRVVMAPMTRNRATEGSVPSELTVRYYSQRATAGLIISEATQICEGGAGEVGTPGIHGQRQIEGWKRVTEAVHEQGGKIFAQLWHAGRISHRSLQPGRSRPVAPSSIRAALRPPAYLDFGRYDRPRTLSLLEIVELVRLFGEAARNAESAGFDGVEIHAANGYLIDQFLRNGSNQRTDAYGGSIQNRTRFLLEVIEAVKGAFEGGCVGVRLSPAGTFNDMFDSDTEGLFRHVVSELDQSGIDYLHVVEPREGNPTAPSVNSAFCRTHFRRILIAAGGYSGVTARQAIDAGHADLIAFGRLFVSNPDLPARLKADTALNPYDRPTFHVGGERGYVDYPFLSAPQDPRLTPLEAKESDPAQARVPGESLIRRLRKKLM